MLMMETLEFALQVSPGSGRLVSEGRERPAAGESKAQDSSREVSLLLLMCNCPQRPYPHEITVHDRLRYESYDPVRRYCWPWSLVLVERIEEMKTAMAHE
jgi:hypothetical protein